MLEGTPLRRFCAPPTQHWQTALASGTPAPGTGRLTSANSAEPRLPVAHAPMQWHRLIDRRRQASRGGFTFVEAMVAITITAVAGAAILLGISSSLESTQTAMEQTVALGLAQQLMDELAGKQFAENPSSPYDTPLGPTQAESAGPGRTQFTNLADYNGMVEAPPLDLWGIPLGNGDGQGGTRNPAMQIGSYLAHWQRATLVYYVDPNNLANALPAGQTSNYRAVEVHVSVQDRNGALRQILVLRRVFAYVPSS